MDALIIIITYIYQLVRNTVFGLIVITTVILYVYLLYIYIINVELIVGITNCRYFIPNIYFITTWH